MTKNWGWDKFKMGPVKPWSVSQEITNAPEPEPATKSRADLTLSELVALKTKEALAAAAKAKKPAPWGPFARSGSSNGR